MNRLSGELKPWARGETPEQEKSIRSSARVPDRFAGLAERKTVRHSAHIDLVDRSWMKIHSSTEACDKVCAALH